ncbi:hypothetical protein PCNPT3_05580 [Psychromonas sp. CNPT3]|uniref:hypothetical protein n=1 Tax=Psychromonas sp. CNPT3 TaxID=314282 RepID=UPI00006E4260|nr:hypothetical protein [Psychromonas sp. CNPT3]AGH81058.1 hypothetical protein PCNPT3_05580 [Psychromonas sp. CNPT3]
MKKLIFLILLATTLWKFYPTEEKSGVNDLVTQLKGKVEHFLKKDNVQFTCDDRQYCTQMNSQDEALYFIENCPNVKIVAEPNSLPCKDDPRF